MSELTFGEELEQDLINVPRASLRLAKEISYPDLEIPKYLEQIEDLTLRAAQIINPKKSFRMQAKALSEFLFTAEGFQGNFKDGLNPKNCYLNELLDRKLGLEIPLSILYADIAQRLEIPITWVDLPGHFIVRVENPKKAYFIDPSIDGFELSIKECKEWASMEFVDKVPFEPQWLEPITPKHALICHLENLFYRLDYKNDKHKIKKVLEYLVPLRPEKPFFMYCYGSVLSQLGERRKAIEAYEAYLLRETDPEETVFARLFLQAEIKDLARKN